MIYIVLAIWLFGGLLAMQMPAAAEERSRRLEIWDVELGASVAQLPDEFVDYAAGAVRSITAEGVEKAMTKCNRRDPGLNIEEA